MNKNLGLCGFLLVALLGAFCPTGAFGWWPWCYNWVGDSYSGYTREYVPYYVANPPVHYGWSILRPLERPQVYREDMSPQVVYLSPPARPAEPLRLVNPYVPTKGKSAPAATPAKPKGEPGKRKAASDKVRADSSPVGVSMSSLRMMNPFVK